MAALRLSSSQILPESNSCLILLAVLYYVWTGRHHYHLWLPIYLSDTAQQVFFLVLYPPYLVELCRHIYGKYQSPAKHSIKTIQKFTVGLAYHPNNFSSNRRAARNRVGFILNHFYSLSQYRENFSNMEVIILSTDDGQNRLMQNLINKSYLRHFFGLSNMGKWILI